MALAVIVQAHHKPEQLKLLLEALRHRDARVYLHLDRSAAAVEVPEDVTLLPRRRTPWGGAELVDVALDGLRRGLADGCDYFTLISGQDFPLRPVSEIIEFFDGAPSYVEHWPTHESVHRFAGRDRTSFYSFDVRGRREQVIPRGEDTSHLNRRGKVLNTLLRARTAFKPSRSFPAYAEPYTGSAWWNIDRQAADYITRFVWAHPDFRSWFTHAWIPDEFFFQSILAGTAYAGEVINSDLRFLLYGEGYHPQTLTIDHLEQLRSADALFARKFDIDHDRAIIDALVLEGQRAERS